MKFYSIGGYSNTPTGTISTTRVYKPMYEVYITEDAWSGEIYEWVRNTNKHGYFIQKHIPGMLMLQFYHEADYMFYLLKWS